ncbi:class I SAM-dependent methyltransferase [Occultella gossypii]|uniref:Class I SAM-dependent methyltransferase n=1 Tax=Occultella gossypii TaxID=2800820 RepID=A0ABS7S844_9MICO|nr:class I SAM-dependent methyltransferase [Occultella gossypii]MBZ2196415.1 class I SAM-dependent methyltransferase [Occultella gossypii]
MGNLPYLVKSTYAKAMRASGRLLTRARVLSAEPPERSHRLKHWAYSLTRVHDSLAIVELGVPWWTYDAIDHIERLLTARDGDVRVFEYGSGASTFWLADRAREIHSVEHHVGFAETIGPELATLDNVTFHVVEPSPSQHPAIGSSKSGNAGLDFKAYVATIDTVGGLFDVVVIDGRARAGCLEAAISHLADDGIIVFDNSRRRRYRTAIERSGLHESRFKGLTPTLPYPEQTSVLTNAARN